MKQQYKNFGEYQTSPEHITRLLNDDKSAIRVEFLDGSSYVCEYGSQYWYLNGKRHRTDGPAVIYGNGAQRWCLNDKEMTEKQRARATGKQPSQFRNIFNRLQKFWVCCFRK